MTEEQQHELLELIADARRHAFVAVEKPDRREDAIHELGRWLERCDAALGPMMLTQNEHLPNDVATFTSPSTGKIVGMIYNLGPDQEHPA